MKVHDEHGRELSAALSSCGTNIIKAAGVIFDAAYHGTPLPLNGYAMKRSEEAAMDVLAALDKYRDATKPEAADPVITWPRPSYHRQAEGWRAEDMLPDDNLCEDCPPAGYPTDKTRCFRCPRRGSTSARTVPCLRDDGPEAA